MKHRTVCHRLKPPMRSRTSHKPDGRHTGFLLMKPATPFQPGLPFLLASFCLSPAQTCGGIFFQGFHLTRGRPSLHRTANYFFARFNFRVAAFKVSIFCLRIGNSCSRTADFLTNSSSSFSSSASVLVSERRMFSLMKEGYEKNGGTLLGVDPWGSVPE